MLGEVKRAMAITSKLNRLTFDDADLVRALFSELIGKKVDDSFLLMPPFFAQAGITLASDGMSLSIKTVHSMTWAAST